MSAEPLEALLERMRVGDLSAAEQLFLGYEPELRMIVRRKLSRRLRAKFDSLDVVQSVWVHVLNDFHCGGRSFADPSHLRNFLIRVTRNCLTDRLRHHRLALAFERAISADDAAVLSVSTQPRASELAQANDLWENLLTLCPPEHHELLRLKRQGLPLAEISAKTGLHEDSVRRIIRKLARRLALPDGEMIT